MRLILTMTIDELYWKRAVTALNTSLDLSFGTAVRIVFDIDYHTVLGDAESAASAETPSDSTWPSWSVLCRNMTPAAGYKASRMHTRVHLID
jgi:hypothetical protein